MEGRVVDSVKQWLKRDGRRRTGIIVAHRLSTIRSCDQILYLARTNPDDPTSSAQLAEAGTHQVRLQFFRSFLAENSEFIGVPYSFFSTRSLWIWAGNMRHSQDNSRAMPATTWRQLLLALLPPPPPLLLVMMGRMAVLMTLTLLILPVTLRSSVWVWENRLRLWTSS